MPSIVILFAGMARSYNTGYLNGRVEFHSSEISTLSRIFINWSHSIEEQGARHGRAKTLR